MGYLGNKVRINYSCNFLPIMQIVACPEVYTELGAR
jgi:hypothetical protein